MNILVVWRRRENEDNTIQLPQSWLPFSGEEKKREKCLNEWRLLIQMILVIEKGSEQHRTDTGERERRIVERFKDFVVLSLHFTSIKVHFNLKWMGMRAGEREANSTPRRGEWATLPQKSFLWYSKTQNFYSCTCTHACRARCSLEKRGG